ncbi:hypothetical protein C923_02710, partial [Plasmodium falciparum UGT5.1]
YYSIKIYRTSIHSIKHFKNIFTRIIYKSSKIT